MNISPIFFKVYLIGFTDFINYTPAETKVPNMYIVGVGFSKKA